MVKLLLLNLLCTIYYYVYLTLCTYSYYVLLHTKSYMMLWNRQMLKSCNMLRVEIALIMPMKSTFRIVKAQKVKVKALPTNNCAWGWNTAMLLPYILLSTTIYLVAMICKMGINQSRAKADQTLFNHCSDDLDGHGS